MIFLACTPPPPETLALVVDVALPRAEVEAQLGVLVDWLGGQGITVSVGTTRVQAMPDPLGGLDFAPLVAQVNALATPTRPEVVFVVTDEVAGAKSPVARQTGVLSGFALSPSYTPDFLHLSLPRRFSPVVFLSWREQRARLPEDRLWTWVHEVGHLAGLEHVASRGNVMAVGGGAWLSGEQEQAIENYFSPGKR